MKNDESSRNAFGGAAYIYAAEYGGGLAILNNAGKNVGLFGGKRCRRLSVVY